MKINAFIACRLGSTRIKFKNLLLLQGKPLFSYLTDNAILCKNITSLYMNSLYGARNHILCYYKDFKTYVKILSVTKEGFLTILMSDQSVVTVSHADIQFVIE